MDTTERIGEAVNGYLNQGWNILPVKAGEKRPLMLNWAQYIRQRADIDTVTNWFKQLAGVGVGLVTGQVSGVVVLDVESACPLSLEEILQQYPTQLVSRSGSGGYHLFFKYPQGAPSIRNRVRLLPWADLRADGGFIVLPPTVHPNGQPYAWVYQGEPGVFPAALMTLQRTPSVQQNNTWVSDTLRGVTEGGRNDTCAKLAGYFLKKGISTDIVETLLLEWNNRNDPPLPANEIITTVKSISRNHSQTSLQYTGVEYNPDQPATSNASTSPALGGFDIVKLTDYIKSYGNDGTSWLVDEWLPEKSVTFLVSPPESFKTWILLDLAISVATGYPFLGSYEVRDSGPVLVIQQEDNHGGLAERLALILEQRCNNNLVLNPDEWQIPCLPDVPVYIHPSRMLRFDNPTVLEELEARLQTLRPKVVLIDPLYSATSTDNYMASSAEQMMILKTWRDKYGCTFVIAHHSKKNIDPDSTAREDSWGSQFLNAFLEAGWQIRRNPKLGPNEIVVRRHSKVLGNQPPISLSFNINTVSPLQYDVVVHKYDSGNAMTPQPAQAAILELIGKTPITQSDVARKMGKSASTVSRQIKQLESAGFVERMPDGKIKVKEIM